MMQERLGFSAEALAPIDIAQPVRAAPKPTLPPPNGIGSPEDSLQNCLRLVPKPPKKDQHRWQTLVGPMSRGGGSVAHHLPARLVPGSGRGWPASFTRLCSLHPNYRIM